MVSFAADFTELTIRMQAALAKGALTGEALAQTISPELKKLGQSAQRNLLESGDIASALTAAQAIGDDRLQRQATGTVTPEKWTHGSSDERMTWFKRGYEGGTIDGCNTFAPGAVK